MEKGKRKEREEGRSGLPVATKRQVDPQKRFVLPLLKEQNPTNETMAMMTNAVVVMGGDGLILWRVVHCCRSFC